VGTSGQDELNSGSSVYLSASLGAVISKCELQQVESGRRGANLLVSRISWALDKENTLPPNCIAAIAKLLDGRSDLIATGLMVRMRVLVQRRLCARAQCKASTSQQREWCRKNVSGRGDRTCDKRP